MKLTSTELSTRITLTQRELLNGSIAGALRQVESLKNSRNGKAAEDYESKGYGKEGQGLWNNSIEGVLGEIAVARYLGLYPYGLMERSNDHPDVGEHYEVRTRCKEWMELFFKVEDKTREWDKPDKPDKYYILVTGSYGTYDIRGWISAPEILSHPEWHHNNEGKTTKRYWVPTEFLHPMEELPECPVTYLPNSSPSTKVTQYDSYRTS